VENGSLILAIALDQKVTLAARAFSFVRDRRSDAVRVALVRDPNNPDSVEEATQVDAAIGSGIDVGRLHLTVTDVAVDQLDRATNVDVIWLTKGLSDRDFARAAEIANRNHAVSVSSDLSCVQDELCVLGVQARPTVRIILSAAAATKAGIDFQPAFRMMVTER